MQIINFRKITKLDFHTNEAFKTLRTNIRFCGDNIKVIAFTSTFPDEGKSSVSFNLARSIAEDDRNVLYIDADIRKSVIAARYELDHEVKGLSHLLTAQVGLNDVICKVENIPNMYTILTGQVAPNPSELLGSENFGMLINAVRNSFDYIIIDCPPLGSVIDAAVVAAKCDGVVLVVESDNVSRNIVIRIKDQLEKSGCKILGAVLNKVDTQNGKGYYGAKYYGKYGKYGKYYGKGYYGSGYGYESHKHEKSVHQKSPKLKKQETDESMEAEEFPDRNEKQEEAVSAKNAMTAAPDATVSMTDEDEIDNI